MTGGGGTCSAAAGNVVYTSHEVEGARYRMRPWPAAPAARRAGILPADAVVQHVGFGLVLGEDGKRFRTRSGDLVRLVELLDEAYQRCKEQVRVWGTSTAGAVTCEHPPGWSGHRGGGGCTRGASDGLLASMPLPCSSAQRASR